jgi:hypothetical protein
VSISTSPALRCPRCSAQVFAGSDWCTLCYADLRPAPPAPPEPAAPPVDRAPAPAPVGAAVNGETPDQPGRRGKHARPAPAGAVGGAGSTSGASAEAAALADRLLAELAASGADNPLGVLTTVLDTRAKRMAAGASAAGAVTCVLILLMWAVGALL